MTATGTGSPNKLKSTNFKTPTKGANVTSNAKGGFLLDSNADFGSVEDSMMKSTSKIEVYNP